jgi:hypothetical protein
MKRLLLFAALWLTFISMAAAQTQPARDLKADLARIEAISTALESLRNEARAIGERIAEEAIGAECGQPMPLPKKPIHYRPLRRQTLPRHSAVYQ